MSWPYVSLKWRLLCAAFIFCVWGLLPALIMRVEAIEIHNDSVVAVRTFPLDRIGLPRPLIAAHQSVRRIGFEDTRTVCTRDTYWRFTMAQPVVRWSLDWAEECRVMPYEYRIEWTIWLGGIVPLRPITREIIMLEPAVE
jgi:hypothetical protein